MTKKMTGYHFYKTSRFSIKNVILFRVDFLLSENRAHKESLSKNTKIEFCVEFMPAYAEKKFKSELNFTTSFA